MSSLTRQDKQLVRQSYIPTYAFPTSHWAKNRCVATTFCHFESAPFYNQHHTLSFHARLIFPHPLRERPVVSASDTSSPTLSLQSEAKPSLHAASPFRHDSSFHTHSTNLVSVAIRYALSSPSKVLLCWLQLSNIRSRFCSFLTNIHS